MQNHHHFYIRVQEIVKKTNVWYEIVEKNSSLFLTTYFFWVLSYQTLVFLTILWHGVKKLMRYPPCTNFSHVTNLLKRPTFDMKLTKKNRLYKKHDNFAKNHPFWSKMAYFAKNHPSRSWIDNFKKKSTILIKNQHFGQVHMRFPKFTSQTAYFEGKTNT
jgi:hypothetical protein